MNKPISIRTVLGNEFIFAKPYKYHFPIGEISHALSMLCRFGGHCKEHYSVAQHSIWASYLVEDEFALAALMHDSAEAYLGDMVAPLKAMLPQYKEIERMVERELFAHHKVDFDMVNSPEVKHADLVMLATEKRDILRDPDDSIWTSLEGIKPLPESCVIIPWPSGKANVEFTRRYAELTHRAKYGG